MIPAQPCKTWVQMSIWLMRIDAQPTKWRETQLTTLNVKRMRSKSKEKEPQVARQR
jgi:hypothetical protein